MYYDTVGDPGRKKVDVWRQSSFDDGVTWSAAVKVTSAQTDETAAGADSVNQLGDYNSLSGTGGVFFPSWTDRRSNAREEIWTAKVTDPFCMATGAPAIGAVTASGPNQIQVAWGNGSPASTAFNLYRAVGTCAAHGAFTRIAGPVAGSPQSDGAVSGGTTYAYQVTGIDATGNCESAPSACAAATATGACTAGACTPAPADSGLDFYTVAPCRLIDTRNPDGPLAGPALQAGAERTFVLAGSCGVPSTAKALAVNVTAVSPTASGLLSLFPADQTVPIASTINFVPAVATRANNAIISLAGDASGGIKVQNSSTGTVHLLLDVVGYFQ